MPHLFSYPIFFPTKIFRFGGVRVSLPFCPMPSFALFIMLMIIRVVLTFNEFCHWPLKPEILPSALTGATSSSIIVTSCAFGVEVATILPWIALSTCLGWTPSQLLIVPCPGIIHICRFLEHSCQLLHEAIILIFAGIWLLLQFCLLFCCITFRKLCILIENLHF